MISKSGAGTYCHFDSLISDEQAFSLDVKQHFAQFHLGFANSCRAVEPCIHALGRPGDHL